MLKPGEEGIAFIRGYELMDQVRTPGRYRSIGVSTGGMSLRTGAVQLAGSGVQFRSLGKGDLLITNKRFIFMGQSTSFEVKLNRVLGALPYRSGFELSISGKPRTYTFYAPLDGRIPVAILRGAIKNFSIS